MWLLVGLALAGETVQDMDMVTAWRLAPGGTVVKLGGWVAGRGRCPGQAPSLTPAADGRPCTYHDPSPLVPWPVFWAHVQAAQGTDAAGWLSACGQGALCDWLRALPEGEATMAWEQARVAW